MSIKLTLAKSAEGREGAKVSFGLGTDKIIHELKLHQDDKGEWWPELKIDFSFCNDKGIDQLLSRLSARLEEVQRILSSKEMDKIVIAAEMVSK